MCITQSIAFCLIASKNWEGFAGDAGAPKIYCTNSYVLWVPVTFSSPSSCESRGDCTYVRTPRPSYRAASRLLNCGGSGLLSAAGGLFILDLFISRGGDLFLNLLQSRWDCQPKKSRGYRLLGLECAPQLWGKEWVGSTQLLKTPDTLWHTTPLVECHKLN